MRSASVVQKVNRLEKGLPRGALLMGVFLVLVIPAFLPLDAPMVQHAPARSNAAMAGRAPAVAENGLSSPGIVPPRWSLASLRTAPLAPTPDAEPGINVPGATYLGEARIGKMHVLMTLAYSNQSALGTLLAELSNPSSPFYHQYLTSAQFDTDFAPSAAAYDSVLEYVSSFNVSGLATFPDRTTVSFYAPSAVINAMFHTQISQFRAGDKVYYSPQTGPKLPSPLSSVVAGMVGLSSYASARTFSASQLGSLHAAAHPLSVKPATGYLPPVTYNGAQLEYAPDLQVAYDELSLFSQHGYPTDEVVATILFNGTYGGGGSGPCTKLSTGAGVGPFDPADIYDFYNETLPAGEPHSKVFGVPLGGASSPGLNASCDTTGTTIENTLDLEMVGSLAPGSSVYNVYGPNTLAYLDQAFASILSPGAGEPAALANVSVISNSWGGPESNDSAWYSDLEQAQARGITVLACSGDSADDPSTTWLVGDTFSPEAMAYNSFGDVSVGGTEVTLGTTAGNPGYLHDASNKVWYDKVRHLGSSGGISSVFPEPAWQLSSLANKVIGGKGRGAPDLGAIANNTLITITVDGVQYRATNASGSGAFEWAFGTSVSSPVEAGVIAEADHVLKAEGNPGVGYPSPDLYALGNLEYSTCSGTSPIGCFPGTGYNSLLPTLPFIDCSAGGNYAYTAAVGYDLATGWGALDAYNYTMYILHVSSAGVHGRLSGVDNALNLTGLSVTSPGVKYNASIQQNFFLANSLGAPVYWIQNVVYVASSPGGWSMDFTGWTVYPFFGTDTLYRYDFPSAVSVTTPVSFNLSTTLSQGTGFDGQTVTYSFGDGQPALTLAVPGASYIVGSLWYNYSWQGTNYTNEYYSTSSAPGSLCPQFGIVGGPSAGNGSFQAPTSGTMYSQVEPWGTGQWLPAPGEPYSYNVDETGELAQNLVWDLGSTRGSWTLGISTGSTTQGILSYDPRGGTTYPILFDETGLAPGTPWSVTLNGIPTTSSSPSDTTYAGNGTYHFTVTPLPGYSASPSSGNVTVNGASPPSTSIAFLSVLPSIASFTANPNPVPVNMATTLTVTAKGGTTPYTYTYTSLPTGCTTSNTASLSCTPTTAGTFTTMVQVVDAMSKSAFDNGTITVEGATVGPTITFFNASRDPVTVNTTTTLSVYVNGGTPPYHYAYQGLPPGCLSGDVPSLPCTPNVPGTYTVEVAVTDSNSKTATDNRTLIVSPLSGGGGGSSPTILGLSAGTFDQVLALILVAIVATTLVVAWSRKHGRMPTPPPAPSQGASRDPPPQQATPQPPAQPPQTAAASFCDGCGSPVASDYAFCMDCGRQVHP